jgi:hypothetical protein
MKIITASVELPCSVARFWEIYLDEAFLRELYLSELQYKAFSVLEATADTRKIRIVPKINLPGPLEKLMAGGFVYENHGALDRASNTWSFRMVQPAGPDGKAKKEMLTTSGKVHVEALADGRCKRSDEVSVEGKIFGLGGIIEATAEKETRAASAKEFALVRRWAEAAKR